MFLTSFHLIQSEGASTQNTSALLAFLTASLKTRLRADGCLDDQILTNSQELWKMSIFLTSTTLAVLVQLKSASVGTKNPIHCVDKQPQWALLLCVIFKWGITMLISNTTHKIPQIYWTFSPTPYWWVFAKKLINKSLIDRFLSPCSWGVNAIFARKMALAALCSRHETCFNGFWCSFTIN